MKNVGVQPLSFSIILINILSLWCEILENPNCNSFYKRIENVSKNHLIGGLKNQRVKNLNLYLEDLKFLFTDSLVHAELTIIFQNIFCLSKFFRFGFLRFSQHDNMYVQTYLYLFKLLQNQMTIVKKKSLGALNYPNILYPLFHQKNFKINYDFLVRHCLDCHLFFPIYPNKQSLISGYDIDVAFTKQSTNMPWRIMCYNTVTEKQ